jgi:hypothetical protein
VTVRAGPDGAATDITPETKEWIPDFMHREIGTCVTFGRDQRSIIKGKCNLHMIRSSYADKVRPKVVICESALFQTNQ